MELAVNTFSKGIQLDSHPMVQGNESLTDCLNGTFITMNGNEIILQNDMGNRRVDNAFLPSGFEPVGIKEYGGIIYVAAYNPITNRSQIGSFPSPERKINEYDDDELGCNISYEFECYEDTFLNKLKCLKLDSILYPLTGKNSLHAGDKFVIYSNSNDVLDFSNYDNVISINSKDGYKYYVKSPKNKKFTLSIGILNSLNQFVDITKTLCRWNGDKLINTEDYSDDIKFNIGYFISTSKPNITETINDSKLIEERQKLPINTYAYKLVGPMYAKLNLNHVESFSYNIYGTTNDNKTRAELYIEGFLTYNCPDGAKAKENTSGDSVYYTYDEGVPDNTFKGFALFDAPLSFRNPEEDLNKYNYESKYNPKTNLYTVKIVKHYKEVPATDPKNKIYNYVLGVYANYDNYFLSGLSTKGSIDFNLLGSGRVKLNTWRFINDIEHEYTVLTYGFEAYPKYKQRFLNLKFTFEDVRDGSKHILEGLQLNNGRSIITFNWSDLKDSKGNVSKLNFRKLYNVTASWEIYDEEENKIIVSDEKDTKITNLFLLTTELFNDCYNLNSSNFINNYVTPDENERKIKEDKLNIRIGINYNLANNCKISDDKISKKLLNIVPTYGLSDIFYIKYERNFEVNLKSRPELYIIDEKLYPDFIKLNKRLSSNVNITNFKLNSDYTKPAILGVNKLDSTSSLIDPKDLITIGEFSTENNAVNGKITFIDIFKAKEQKKNKTITNAFDSMELFIDKFASQDLLKGKYGGVYLDFDSRQGPDDDHYVHLIWNLEKCSINLLENGVLPERDCVRLDSSHYEGGYHFVLNDYIQRFYDELDSNLDKTQLFIYCFISGNVGEHALAVTNSKNNIAEYDKNKLYSMINNARVWWRTSDDKWALFYNVYDKTSDGNNVGYKLDKFIRNNIPHKSDNFLIYRAYDEYQKELGVPHDKYYAYNDSYYITLDGYIEYTYSGENNFVYGSRDNDVIKFTSSLNEKGTNTYKVNSGWERIEYNDEYNEYDPYTGYALDDCCNFNGETYRNIEIHLQGVPPVTLVTNLKTTSLYSELVKLESSQKFLDEVNKIYSDMSFDCIDLKTGNNSDINGNLLNKDSFYYREENGLVKVKAAELYFKVDSDITLPDTKIVNGLEVLYGNINSILYNYTTKKSTPKYKFDKTGGGDDFTTLDYSNILVVNIPYNIA